MGLAADEPVEGAACSFCAPDLLQTVLTETPHFRVVADFAPLVEGHTLIMPREHFACYGVVPLDYEAELMALKRRVARFFRMQYRPAVFFEHGVFRQTVFHAHLHAFPFGPVNLRLFELAHPDGRQVHSLADVHSWFATRGHYFYIEQPRMGEGPLEAAIFPPEQQRYFQVLGSIREQTNIVGNWRPSAERRELAAPQMAALATAWRAFEASGSSAVSERDES